MSDRKQDNAAAWGMSGVQDFFEEARATTDQVYASEWFFLKDRLKEGMTVLDIGCAQGGFASVLSEHLKEFSYTGVDVSSEMIERAREKHSQHVFYHVSEGDYSVLGRQSFDLVLVLGILHLHETWRDTLRAAWAHTGKYLLADLREHGEPTIEDKNASYFRMDFGDGDAPDETVCLPYIIVNSAEALKTVTGICSNASGVSHYGYLHSVSGSAATPVETVMANVWCVERG